MKLNFSQERVGHGAYPNPNTGKIAIISEGISPNNGDVVVVGKKEYKVTNVEQKHSGSFIADYTVIR